MERRLALAEERAARSGVPVGQARAADGGDEGFYAGLREMRRADEEMRERAIQGAETDRLGREVMLRRMELENAERGQALLRKWREWHVPLSMLFFATLTIHVVSVYYY